MPILETILTISKVTLFFLHCIHQSVISSVPNILMKCFKKYFEHCIIIFGPLRYFAFLLPDPWRKSLNTTCSILTWLVKNAEQNLSSRSVSAEQKLTHEAVSSGGGVQAYIIVPYSHGSIEVLIENVDETISDEIKGGSLLWWGAKVAKVSILRP